MIEKCLFKFELSAFYSWACHMIAYTLNSLVNVQGASISNLWWEIHKQVMAGNSTFLWFLCLTTNVIASFTSSVFYSIKCNLVICYIHNTMLSWIWWLPYPAPYFFQWILGYLLTIWECNFICNHHMVWLQNCLIQASKVLFNLFQVWGCFDVAIKVTTLQNCGSIWNWLNVI